MMSTRFLLSSLLLGALAVVACNGVSAEPPAAAGGALPCAVDDVLARRCRDCHGATPRFGAPMPLVTHADLVATAVGDPGRRVFELVGERIHDTTRRMPQPPNLALSADDMATLDSWVKAGAPSGETCSTPTKANVPAQLGCTPDVHVKPATAYRLPAGVPDALVCYGFESSVSAKRHIVGIAPAIGAGRHLHHVTLLQSDVAVSPVPALCSPESMTTMRSLYGWAPGARGLELPPEAGLPDEPGSHYVVQLHYVNASNEPAPEDASGFDLCTTSELRPNDADVMAFGTMEITIPARTPAWTKDCSITVPPEGDTTHLFAVFPHMHELGRAIRTTVRSGGTGEPVDLGSVPEWNIANQAWLPVDYTLKPGDVVDTSCTWGNPNDHGVGYGPTSSDEMCFSYAMYFPKIQASTWHWSLPALYSTCR
jgi:hypothetical protein